MNKKKVIAVAIVLALVLLIGGMLAYFTDTDTKSNTFTLGNVNIKIDETFTEADAQNLMPNQQVAKTPVVTNESTKNPAYVFATVTIPCYDDNGALTPLYTLTGTDSSWNLMSTSTPDATAKTITYTYNYGTSSAMTELAASASTPALFTTVTVANITGAQAGTVSASPNVVINAYGIQTKGLSVTAPADIFGLF